MSSETAGRERVQGPSKSGRDSYAIVVSTLQTHRLRVEQLDASTVLLHCSGPSSVPRPGLWDVVNVEALPLAGAPRAVKAPASADKLELEAFQDANRNVIAPKRR